MMAGIQLLQAGNVGLVAQKSGEVSVDVSVEVSVDVSGGVSQGRNDTPQ